MDCVSNNFFKYPSYRQCLIQLCSVIDSWRSNSVLWVAAGDQTLLCERQPVIKLCSVRGSRWSNSALSEAAGNQTLLEAAGDQTLLWQWQQVIKICRLMTAYDQTLPVNDSLWSNSTRQWQPMIKLCPSMTASDQTLPVNDSLWSMIKLYPSMTAHDQTLPVNDSQWSNSACQYDNQPRPTRGSLPQRRIKLRRGIF
jgi:hypothetical protein